MRKVGSCLRWVLISLSLLAVVAVPSISVLPLVSDHVDYHKSSVMVSSPVQTSTSPGLNLTLGTTSVTMGLGTDAIVELTIIGTNGFNDSVALSSSMVPNPPGTSGSGFSGSFTKDTFRISAGSLAMHVNVTIDAYTLPPYLPYYPPLGSYTLTVFATGQTPPLYVASAQMQVTVQPYAPPDPRLRFQLGYLGRASPGSMIQLEGNFTDIGNVQANIAGLDFSGEFGTYNMTSEFPTWIYPGQMKMFRLTITIPVGMSVGNHTISAMSTWQYYSPNHYDSPSNWFYPGGWNTGNAISVSGSIRVVPKNSSGPASWIVGLSSIINLVAGNPLAIAGLACYASLVTLASILVIRGDQRRKRTQSKDP